MPGAASLQSRVRVVRDGDPEVGIPGVRLESDASDMTWITDSDGRAILSWVERDTPAILVTASAPEWETTDARVTGTPDGGNEVAIVLRAGGRVSGRVLTSQGGQLLDAAIVLCWPSRRDWTTERLQRALAGRQSPDLQIVRTTPGDCSFTFDQLDSSERYSLAAYARGHWPKSFPIQVPAGTSGVECTLRDLFGVKVQLVGPGAASQLTGDGPSWGRDDLDESAVEAIHLHVAEQPLFAELYGEASLRGITGGERGTERAHLILYARDDGDRSPITLIDFWAHPPGCEEVRATVNAHWLGRGLESMSLPTRAIANCFGTFRLGTPLGADTSWNARAQLVLREIASGRTLRAWIDLHDSSTLTFQGVPCGEYEWRLHATYTVYSWPRPGEPLAVLDVRASAVTEAGYDDRPRLGAAEVFLVDQYGRNYNGAASLEFRMTHEGREFARNAIHAPQAPYRCALLYEGDWAVAVEVRSPDIEVMSPSVPFRVERRKTTDVAVPIRRR